MLQRMVEVLGEHGKVIAAVANKNDPLQRADYNNKLRVRSACDTPVVEFFLNLLKLLDGLARSDAYSRSGREDLATKEVDKLKECDKELALFSPATFAMAARRGVRFYFDHCGNDVAWLQAFFRQAVVEQRDCPTPLQDAQLASITARLNERIGSAAAAAKPALPSSAQRHNVAKPSVKPAARSSAKCNDFIRNKCSRGDSCRFSHSA